jgi:hypothetical protein
VHLPDFFGPHAHAGSLQNALVEAVQGKPIAFYGSKFNRLVGEIPRTRYRDALLTTIAALGESG